MTGVELRAARVAASLTQQDAAARLGVSQAYLSMVERGARPVSAELAARVMAVFEVPATSLPLRAYTSASTDEFDFKQALGSLGYPGFAYLGGPTKMNPAEFLMRAIDTDDLDARVTESLPWVAASFAAMDWEWLLVNAKVHDRQNRLAFVMALGSDTARNRGDFVSAEELSRRVAGLERSRLAGEDTLCKESMTRAERTWLKDRRTPLAAHWNLLADLTLEQVDYAPI
jgi:transcriptional regulator with XRE-family HTH domain